MQKLKKRIQIFLQNKYSHVVLNMTREQYLEFRALGMPELIYWHGNQLLSGAPFFPSSIPPVIYFQWGNLFGVIKYVVLAEEKSMKANVLIYFEDMQDRLLNQCVAEYEKNIQHELKIQNEILYENKIESKFNEFLIKTPTLRP